MGRIGRSYVPVSEREREVLLAAFMSSARWTRVSYRWRPNLRDEADNHIVELAIAGSAELIVTNNGKDFRRGELAFPEIKILSTSISKGSLERAS